MNDTWNSDDIDAAKADLVAAGWVAKTSTLWKSPGGSLHVGPAGAWRVMKRAQNDESAGILAAQRATFESENAAAESCIAAGQRNWAVTVFLDGEEIVTIGRNHLSGRDLSPADEAAIRTAAQHLLGFVGGHRRCGQMVPTGTGSTTCYRTFGHEGVCSGQRMER